MSNIQVRTNGAEDCVMVPRRLLEALMSPRVDSLHDDARLALMAQNPGDFYHWSKSVLSVSASVIKELTWCLAQPKVSAR